MGIKVLLAVALTVLSQAMGGCRGAQSIPSGPSPNPQPMSQPAPVPPPPTKPIDMQGAVFDTVYRGIAGASVDVLNGPDAGLSTVTDSAGSFSLTGRFDRTTQFRAAHADHVSQIHSFN